MTTTTHSAEPHSVSHYLQIWATILVLFVVSIAIAQISHSRPLVLIAAFSIAAVQAVLVAAYFMHLKEEKAYITYLLLSMMLALVLLYTGTMADVNHTSGTHWVATDTTQLIKDHAEAAESHADTPTVEHAIGH
jgi:caa(3)-type oxidase subunit IV